MVNLINKILHEATYERDERIDIFIRNIINQVKLAFNNFNGQSSNEFEYSEEGKTVIIEHKVAGTNLTIIFYDRSSKYADQIKGGVHIFPANTIKIYGCNIDWEEGDNEIKGHWFNLNIEENVLYHELVHFYDFNFRKNIRLKKQPYSTSRSTEKEKSKYYNHGVEFNAYFLQKIMPLINKFKELFDNKQLPVNYNFQKFVKGILKDEDANVYYQRLDKKMRKHFIKRLADYYQKIMNGINKENID